MTANTSLLFLPTHSSTDAEPGGPNFVDSMTNSVLIFLYILIVSLGTTGNAVVIWMVTFQLPATVTNVWLVNLAIADLIFSLSRIPSLLRSLVFNHWAFGGFLCKLSGMLKYANMFCSVLLLSAISMDRAICVCRPLLAKRHRSLNIARMASTGLWLVSVLLSFPFFAHRIVEKDNNNLSKCTMEPRDSGAAEGTKLGLYVLRFLCGFLLPFLVILACSAKAALGISRSRLTCRSKPLKILVYLVTIFFLCWAPYHCLLLAKMVNGKTRGLRVGLDLSKGLAYFNSCLNPLLYFFLGFGRGGKIKRGFFSACQRALEVDREDFHGPDMKWGQGCGLVSQNQALELSGPTRRATVIV